MAYRMEILGALRLWLRDRGILGEINHPLSDRGAEIGSDPFLKVSAARIFVRSGQLYMSGGCWFDLSDPESFQKVEQELCFRLRLGEGGRYG